MPRDFAMHTRHGSGFSGILELTANPEDAWRDSAICAQTDPELFFPEKGGSTKDARTVCLVCPVRAECLRAAMEADERYGIFGGFSERDRSALQRGNNPIGSGSVMCQNGLHDLRQTGVNASRHCNACAKDSYERKLAASKQWKAARKKETAA